MPSEKKQKTPDVDTALTQIEALPDHTVRAQALADIAPKLSNTNELRRALDLAQALDDDSARTEALRRLVGGISEDLLPTVLRSAQSIEDEEHKATLQSAIAARLRSGENWTKQFAQTVSNAVNGPWLPIALSFLVALAIAGALGWFIWLKLMLPLWTWGYGEFSWRSFVAWLPLFYLGIVPLVGLGLLPVLLEFWGEYGAVRKQVTSAREAQGQIEQALQEHDPQKLVLIISYSRQMLSEYYAIAMSQAQRSFRYCLIAMWLGFFVLMIGVLDNFMPIRSLIVDVLPATGAGTENVQGAALSPNELVLITGVVIEFIAAAFLWVYRFSIQQQTYYYRRQLGLHNALLAQRLSESMTTSKDEAVKLVVQRLLEDPVLQQMEAPSSSGLSNFFKGK